MRICNYPVSTQTGHVGGGGAGFGLDPSVAGKLLAEAACDAALPARLTCAAPDIQAVGQNHQPSTATHLHDSLVLPSDSFGTNPCGVRPDSHRRSDGHTDERRRIRRAGGYHCRPSPPPPSPHIPERHRRSIADPDDTFEFPESAPQAVRSPCHSPPRSAQYTRLTNTRRHHEALLRWRRSHSPLAQGRW